jgi:hypothetical protein
MKLLAEIRALFFSQGIGGLPADEFNAPGFDSLWHEGAQLDGIALLALCLPDNVADDLAQRLRVSLKRLGRKETHCGYGFDVFADRHIDAFFHRGAFAPGKRNFPAVGAQIEVEVSSFCRGFILVGRMKADALTLTAELNMGRES